MEKKIAEIVCVNLGRRITLPDGTTFNSYEDAQAPEELEEGDEEESFHAQQEAEFLEANGVTHIQYSEEPALLTLEQYLRTN